MPEPFTKYALVTGGSRGIGRAISIKLAQDGYNLLVNYHRNDEAAHLLMDELSAVGGHHELLKFDVGNAEQCQLVLSNWMQSFPDKEIHVLVNNTGIRKDNLLIFMPEEDWISVLDTNLYSFFHVTKIVCAAMVRRRAGRIINMASLSGLKGMPGQTNYSASKGGLIGATKALALELAKRNITVNAVAPGFIATDMTEDLNEDELRGLIPMNRFGKPEEVAELVSFLAGDQSAYITGQVISINGGLYS